MRLLLAALALAAWLAGAGRAGAAEDLSELAFQPHPGARLPLAAGLLDETGRAVPLSGFFGGEPVVLVLEYLRCKALCGLSLQRIFASLAGLPLEPGRDFQLLAISIDPRDTPADAAAAKARYLAGYTRPGAAAGVHFLTGPAAATAPIAKAVGFPYRYDPDSGEYLHPVGFVLAGSDGRIDRYFQGFAVPPAELAQGLADAAAGRAVGPLTRLLLLCHLEGAPIGRWTLPIEAAFALANLAAIVALGGVFLAILRRRHG